MAFAWTDVGFLKLIFAKDTFRSLCKLSSWKFCNEIIFVNR